jgi:rRNA maturation endonuclease Nob1
MGVVSDPLRDCENCGRTFNEVVNRRCPACGTEIESDTPMVSR